MSAPLQEALTHKESSRALVAGISQRCQAALGSRLGGALRQRPAAGRHLAAQAIDRYEGRRDMTVAEGDVPDARRYPVMSGRNTPSSR